jgi:pSer/pThr/pTyr-binding forkhead associated (FHA) protein
MQSVPVIVVQIVHILGPLKGQIQEFSEPEIQIGRKSTCHIQFPKDYNIISRDHARIVRDGNRFKVIDQSANGTYLNGKAVGEAYLKNGDVLMFAEGGPKVSFLTIMLDATSDIEQLAPHQ